MSIFGRFLRTFLCLFFVKTSILWGMFIVVYLPHGKLQVVSFWCGNHSTVHSWTSRFNNFTWTSIILEKSLKHHVFTWPKYICDLALFPVTGRAPTVNLSWTNSLQSALGFRDYLDHQHINQTFEQHTKISIKILLLLYINNKLNK